MKIKYPLSPLFSDSLKNIQILKIILCQSGIPQLNNIIIQKNTNINFLPKNILYGNGLKELIFILQMAFDGLIFHITPIVGKL